MSSGTRGGAGGAPRTVAPLVIVLAVVVAVALAAAALLHLAAFAAGEDASFMPKGGRALLLEALGPKPALPEVRRLLATKQAQAQWTSFVAERAPRSSPREQATLAAYLEVNLPLPAAALRAANAEALLAALPRDGRELAWQQCQFCHSLFSSHLTQQRDVQGWRNMFLSPFHRELKMTPAEREEFARYSALNMPMRADDVPAELRF